MATTVFPSDTDLYILDTERSTKVHASTGCPSVHRSRRFLTSFEGDPTDADYCGQCAGHIGLPRQDPPETIHVTSAYGHKNTKLHIDPDCDRVPQTVGSDLIEKPLAVYPPAWRRWCSHCAYQFKTDEDSQ